MRSMHGDRLVVSASVILIACVAWNITMAEDNAGPEYIADAAAERIIYSHQDWGGLGLNTAVRPLDGREALALQIKDTHYAQGLGHHANGEILVELAGQYQTFEAEVGVQWQSGKVGTVVFQVFVDDEKRFDSGVMAEHDAARAVRVSVEGAYDLRLVATDAGDGITCDCANWANARLVANPHARTLSETELADVAPFARIVTWDPERNTGTSAKRTQEFPQADLVLESDVTPRSDGVRVVPAAENGKGCIGLQWAERRFLRRLGLGFADSAQAPPVDGVTVQFWTGESVWQGEWRALEGDIDTGGDQWRFTINYNKNPEMRAGTEKIRWVFPACRTPISIRALLAHTNSRLETAQLRAELENPLPGQQARIEVYNGAILEPEGDGSGLRRTWDLAGALPLKVRYCTSRHWQTDRTVLRFVLPGTAFGVAVDDVLREGCVYVPHAGLFVTSGPSLSEYKRQIAGKRTLLEQVRDMPDQTFAQAWEHVHNPIQDEGPMLLSLACDNRKFVAHRDGNLTFDVYEAPDQQVDWPAKYRCAIQPRFGAGQAEGVTRHLHGEWLPAPVITMVEGGVVYQQRTYVAPCGDKPLPHTNGWLYERPLCVVEYTIENPSTDPEAASLEFAFASDVPNAAAPEVERVPEGVILKDDARLFAFVDTSEAAGLRVETNAGTVALAGDLAPGNRALCTVYVPAWRMARDAYAMLRGAWLAAFEAYWSRLLAPAVQVDVPDELLTNAIRASQVHCLLAARNEAGGERVAAYIASDRYGPLESEAHSVIRGMDMMGHEAFARHSLEYFIHRYNTAGYLTTGYTMMGTGWHLWTLAEHYARTHDRDWLVRVMPEVARVCQWIVRQCDKTKRVDAEGQMAPEFGLVPPGVAADWNRYAYRFFNEAHYCAGLEGAAKALADAGHPDAPALLAEAQAFRENVVRAFHWVQSRAPVEKLQSGAWVPAYPSLLYCFGRVEDIIPGEDWNRSWCSDIEIGAHQLAALGVMDPMAPEAGWMADHMEDFWFLHAGMGDYPEERNRADWFSLGGFAKVQPYYCRNAEIYALRDDVKPFIRSYFNTIPTLLSREILSFWEHFHNRGAWNKTHETGYFLAHTRMMLVMERKEDLWLAPFVTSNWLKDGMSIEVRNAPTRFGKVSYAIVSAVDSGRIEATITPPGRTPPARIVMRLRHPLGKAIRAVTVNGEQHTDFDAEQACIRLAPCTEPIVVSAAY